MLLYATEWLKEMPGLAHRPISLLCNRTSKSPDLEMAGMMKVRYIGKTNPIGFTHGEVYEVISVEKGWYRIIDPFLKDDYLFPPELFEVVE